MSQVIETLDQEELRKVKESALRFISMLRMHIQKEDRILFPAAERALTAEVLVKNGREL